MSTRARLAAAVVGAGALVGAGAGVAAASVDRPPAADVRDTGSRQALALLEDAVHAARTLTWRGTQYVTTWQDGVSTASLVDVRHDPTAGSVLRPVGPDATPVAMPVDLLDTRLLDLLADRYQLRVVRRDRCAGRVARVIEARRPGGGVAGRFWLDDDSGLVVRRDLLDVAGRTVRSAVFVDLSVSLAAPATSYVAGVAQLRPTGEQQDAAALRRQGWPVQEQLPGDLQLYDARLHDAVLQLSYSDGLTTTSVFVQRGSLPPGTRTAVVPVARGGPERQVGSGSGMTWTVLSDGPPEQVRAVAAAMPSQQPPAVRDDLGDRAWRGLARVGSWLDPFR